MMKHETTQRKHGKRAKNGKPSQVENIRGSKRHFLLFGVEILWNLATCFFRCLGKL